jgi:proline iminopeptidase
MKLLLAFSLVVVLIIAGCNNSPVVKQSSLREDQDSKGFIEVGGTKLNYVVEGKGISCLVIGSSIYYPRTFDKKLRDHFKFCFVDMRWFAKDYTTVKPENFTLKTILEDIEKVRSELKLGKVIIIGHSIHGTIAFEYARRYWNG